MLTELYNIQPTIIIQPLIIIQPPIIIQYTLYSQLISPADLKIFNAVLNVFRFRSKVLILRFKYFDEDFPSIQKKKSRSKKPRDKFSLMKVFPMKVLSQIEEII